MLFACFAFGLHTHAHAHAGRFPETQQLLFDGSELVAVASTVGLLVPSDDGWRWTCRAGIGLRLQEDPIWAFAHERFVVASFDGIVVGEPCAMQAVEALRRQVVLDVHVDREGVLWAVTSNGSASNALWRSADGLVWEAHAPLPRPPLYERVRTAPSDPRTIYVAGFVPPETTGERRDASVLASVDGGESFVEHRVPLDEGELTLFLLEVDADDPTRLFARTLRDPSIRSIPERVLESRDGGATWTTRFEVPLFGGFARVGETLFVGGRDPGDPPIGVPGAPPREVGLWRGEADAPLAHVFPDAQVKCLEARDDGLYACFGTPSPFVVGRSNDEGASFASVLAFDEVVGPVACANDAPTLTRCAVEEDAHNREHFGLLDAGVATDAGTDGTRGGGCAVSASVPQSAATWLVALLTWLVSRRSTRASRGRALEG